MAFLGSSVCIWIVCVRVYVCVHAQGSSPIECYSIDDTSSSSPSPSPSHNRRKRPIEGTKRGYATITSSPSDGEGHGPAREPALTCGGGVGMGGHADWDGGVGDSVQHGSRGGVRGGGDGGVGSSHMGWDGGVGDHVQHGSRDGHEGAVFGGINGHTTRKDATRPTSSLNAGEDRIHIGPSSASPTQEDTSMLPLRERLMRRLRANAAAAATAGTVSGNAAPARVASQALPPDAQAAAGGASFVLYPPGARGGVHTQSGSPPAPAALMHAGRPSSHLSPVSKIDMCMGT